MTRTPIKSSHLRSVGHDAATNTLEVEFQNGRVYTYPSVQRSEYHKIMGNTSSGQAFQRLIKDKPFTFQRVK